MSDHSSPTAVQAYPLSTLHRALIAFSALALGYGPRDQVLAAHHVTESDLLAHQEDWERLLVLRASERDPQKVIGLARL